nr:efflux transporter outer membrane subunit [Pararobbsia silviterrae]
MRAALETARRKPVSRRRGLALTLLASLCVSACGTLTHTAWQPPVVDVPEQWHTADAATPATLASTSEPAAPPRPETTDDDANTRTDVDPWWQAFGDADLNRLIERALATSHDLKTAVLNLQAAQFAVDLQHANQMPALSASADLANDHSLHGNRYVSHVDALTASASYVVDFWGALASSTEAAKWEARASAQDVRTAKMSVAATVADDYWLLALLTEQIETSTASVQYDAQTLALTQVRYQSGAITAIDLLSAQQALAIQRAALNALILQSTQTQNALAILIGEAPGEVFAVPSARLMTTLPSVAPGLPAELLGRRPDVRAAEWRTRSALADVDATRASFYPNLTLTGSAGTASDALRNILQNPIGTLAADITAPILNVWTIKAQVGAAQTTYDAAAVAFAKTFEQALCDVENALAARADDQAQVDQWTHALDAARQSEQRVAWQYRTGAVALSNWLDAEQATRTTDAELAGARYALLANQVGLYVALGGR